MKSKKIPEKMRPMPPLSGITALSQDVFLDIMRTAETLRAEVDELLKCSGLSSTQYNALRILRGAGTGGCTCQEITERMITRDPDVTRLLDRLEDRGLVVRARSRQDRRVVCACLTEAGLELIEELDDPVAKLHVRQLGCLGEERLQIIANALRELHNPAAGHHDCDGKTLSP